ncbi:conserved Plasmodium protein, unknown function [Babesia microti strain RI]|uniref:Uncharacterized protein n=1 Tax=Babesia microti (strain RI) TaxID=1133968 RepID=I7I8P1_BABMR|nr:conserved Plasmodium protein, unknown function [Babesia microti strain RI]CCF73433.1 conserved Plasmodium protein, unknown function [Babesia microti strain RI]|eukprot:XP_012648042.1 conserved Plasmodium protein, unknown function [Babesia microti strain RI]
MGIFSTISYIITLPVTCLRYKTARIIDRERVVKLGIICRNFWILFPPLIAYQYIRQKDQDMFVTELFYNTTVAQNEDNDPKSFYNTQLRGGNKYWKMQRDISLLKKAAES